MLEHEVAVNRTNENTTALYKIQESGVKLFYCFIDHYTEEASICPITKQLMTTYLERLGQVRIIVKLREIILIDELLICNINFNRYLLVGKKLKVHNY